MRRQKLLLFLPVVVIFAGCPTEDESKNKVNNFRFNKDEWGEWLRLDTGDTWYISDSQITIREIPYPNKLSLRKENRNAIEVTEGSRKYYIYASRVKDASFKGRVVQGSDNVIGGSEQGVGSIAVVIRNLANASDKTIVTTDEDGNYIVEDIIPWDTYTVTVGGKTWTVTPGDGDDVGIMALRDGVNLKAYLSVGDADRMWDAGYFNINIENTGTTAVAEGVYAYYTLESPDIVAYSPGPEECISLDWLLPGDSVTESVDYYCYPPTGEFDIKRIGLTIVDPQSGITINDYASIKIKMPVDLNINAQSTVQGIVIAPYKKAYLLSTEDRYDWVNNIHIVPSITLPWSTDDYILILTGSGNTAYSIGVGVEPDTQWTNLTDRNIYKPHNSEETATPIGMYEQKMAFLNKGEIAYYRINMSNARP